MFIFKFKFNLKTLPPEKGVTFEMKDVFVRVRTPTRRSNLLSELVHLKKPGATSLNPTLLQVPLVGAQLIQLSSVCEEA